MRDSSTIRAASSPSPPLMMQTPLPSSSTGLETLANPPAGVSHFRRGTRATPSIPFRVVLGIGNSLSSSSSRESRDPFCHEYRPSPVSRLESGQGFAFLSQGPRTVIPAPPAGLGPESVHTDL